MKKILGSIARVIALLSFFLGLYSLATAYSFYIGQRCIESCPVALVNWKEPFYYGLAYLTGGIVLHFIGKWLKK